MATTPMALWFDYTSAAPQEELRVVCRRRFELTLAPADPTHADGAIAHSRPALLVFEFDHPDATRLRLMQTLKRRHPSVPVLMITLAHSEELAVWAFRSRVWNYLVKPVEIAEFEENVTTLREILSGNHARGYGLMAALPPVPGNGGSSPEARHGLAPALRALAQAPHSRVSAADLAELCGLSRFEFSRRFRRAFGTSFQDYLQRMRISEACRRLRTGGATVTDVGYAVGFNDSSYFAQVFRRYTGVLPSVFAANTGRANAEEDLLPELRDLA